jgi:hypothetical protein
MLPGWSGCIPKITRIDATGSTARASPFKIGATEMVAQLLVGWS